MSEKTSKSPNCKRCKKELLAHLPHHTLKSVLPDGSLEIDCYAVPHGKVGDGLKYVLESRAATLVAQDALTQAHKDHAVKLQDAVADAERSSNSKVLSKATALAAENIERTRVQLESTHQAKVTHLEDVLKEVRGDKQLLIADKSALTDRLTACELKSVDLQREIDGLTVDLQEARRQHEDLKQEAQDVLRLAFTIGSHAATIGRKLGIDDVADIEKLFAKPADPRPPIKVEDLTRKTATAPVAPPPIPTPAPKAVVVTAHVAAPEAAPAPVPQPFTVVLDAPTPEPDSSASADDDGDGDESDPSDDDVGDDVIIDEMEAGSEAGDDVSSEAEGSSEDDDVSSEDEGATDEVEVEECRGCDKPSTHGFTFTKRDGKQDRLTTCNPRKHVPDFLQHLQSEAVVDLNGVLKVMPRTAGELQALLKANPINPKP